MYAKTVMYGSVYKYRLPPTYGPSLKSQEKWQLVSVAHSAGTAVQPAGRNTVLYFLWYSATRYPIAASYTGVKGTKDV